jgi:hypothetical protein
MSCNSGLEFGLLALYLLFRTGILSRFKIKGE